MKNYFLYTIICVLCYVWIASYNHATCSPATDKEIKVLLDKGDKKFAAGFYFQAIQFYQEVLLLEDSHIYARYQLGECYRLLFEYYKAKDYYQRVRLADPEHYLLSGYYEGLMHKFLGDYTQAIKSLDAFIAFAKTHKFDDKRNYMEMALREKEGSQFALLNALKPKGDFKFIRLSASVNTAYDDYAASTFLSDSSIAITSTRKESKGSTVNDQYGKFFSDIYLFANNTSDEWQDISTKNGFININTNFSEGTGAFTDDYKTFVFTGCYQEGYCHLFASTLERSRWQKAVPLNEKINTSGYDSKQPAFSAGGDSLFFVSNRPGGYGNMDIWLSVLSADGQWQTPVNLGPDINTPQNELSPFYLSAEHQLFFSSNGHQGYGSYDVFVTSLATPAVTNLGMPFNSSKDDLYLSLGHKKGYLSSNRENTDGNFDIYRFNMTTENAELLSLAGAAGRNSGLPRYADVLSYFSQNDQLYYKELPLEKKEKVQQVVQVRAFQKAIDGRADMSPALAAHFEALSAREKAQIDRLATAQKSFLLDDNKTKILKEDYYYYKELSPEEKTKIKQIIEIRAFQKILQESNELNGNINSFYEQLPLEERKKIDRATDQRKYALVAEYQKSMISDPEEIYFYQSLPTKQKEQISRFVATEIQQKNSLDQSKLKDELFRSSEKLSAQEKEALGGIIQSKILTARTLEQAIAINDIDRNSVSLSNLAFSNPDNITIEGTLVNDKKPAMAVKVMLSNEQGNKTLSTMTNQQGTFKFNNINYHQSQKLVFEQKSSFARLSSYAIEELKVIILQDTIVEETFDNIYFDTDHYKINAASKSILDSLAAFHFRYPDVQIEISAYTDTVGSAIYNRGLSHKRALEAYNYLVDKRVNASTVHIQARGKEIPKEGKNLQYSRRIEFDLKGHSTSYNPTREIFIITAYPILADIASKYRLTLRQLQEMNPQLKGEPAPFTPIRIVSNQRSRE